MVFPEFTDELIPDCATMGVAMEKVVRRLEVFEDIS